MGEADNRGALQRLYSRLSRDGGKVTGQDVVDFTRQVKELLTPSHLFHILATSLRVSGADHLQEAVSYTLFEKFISSLSRHCFPQAEQSAEDQLLAYMRVACFARYRVMLGVPRISTEKRPNPQKKTPRGSHQYEAKAFTPNHTVSNAQSLNQKVSRLYNLVTPRNRMAPTLHNSFLPGTQVNLFATRTQSGAQTCRLPEDSLQALHTLELKEDFEEDTFTTSLKLKAVLQQFQSKFQRLKAETKEARRRKRVLTAAVRAAECHKKHRVMLQLAVIKWRLAARGS